MTEKWQTIIDALSVMKLESVNNETINHMLDYDRMVDAQVLDNLYILKILSLGEYKERMTRYVEQLKQAVHWTEEQLKTANEKGEDYNPMIFYSFCNLYSGTAIENKANDFDWINKWRSENEL